MPEVTRLPKQKEMMEAPEHTVCMLGGLGSSKTRALCMWIVEQMLKPRRFGALASSTYRQLIKSTVRELLKYCAELGLRARFNRADNTIKIGSSVLNLLTMDIPADQLRGPEYDFIAVDEANTLDEDHWDQLQDRAGRTAASPGQIRIATNPVSPGHWIARRFALSPLPGHRLVRMTTYDNKFLSPDYITKLEAKYPPGTAAHKRWMLADFVVNSGVVYGEFGENHIFDGPIPQYVEYVHGLDLGYKDPTVFLSAGIDHLGNIWVYNEYYQREFTAHRNGQEIRPLVKGTVFSDHSETERAAYNEVGVPTVLAHKEVLHGIDLVRSALVRNELKIHRSCTNLIECMYNYAWKTTDAERPDHKWSDPCDALRYLICGSQGNHGTIDALSILNEYTR